LASAVAALAVGVELVEELALQQLDGGLGGLKVVGIRQRR
jgi:hypothetical protein